jgi:hypothetical protein
VVRVLAAVGEGQLRDAEVEQDAAQAAASDASDRATSLLAENDTLRGLVKALQARLEACSARAQALELGVQGRDGMLAASEAPMRSRFTCAVKARQFAERMRPGVRQDKLLSFIAEATRFVEEVLPSADAEAVRSDVDTAAKEALALGYPDGDTEDEE